VENVFSFASQLEPASRRVGKSNGIDAKANSFVDRDDPAAIELRTCCLTGAIVPPFAKSIPADVGIATSSVSELWQSPFATSWH